MSILFMVGTPIGNLEDITLRALETLKQVDVIACEDTRHTQRLLSRFEIKKRLIACHAHNEQQSAEGIVKLLDEGHDVAFVSDAGTPGVSDPGSRLAARVRQSGHQLIPIPGVSALTTIASVAGFVGKTLVFEGFLSPKSGKRSSRIKELLDRNEAFVLYESPFRVVKVLDALRAIEPGRKVLIGREMTKNFEEFVHGSAQEVYEDFSSRQSIKGEFALLISPREKERD
jgi:16S rRNA (cytidine1402-2'-O)-methyltransferase